MTELPAGKELDALVAEKVMGLRVAGFADCLAPEGDWSVRSNDGPPNRPVYILPKCTGEEFHAYLRDLCYSSEGAVARRVAGDDDMKRKEIEEYYRREWERDQLFGHNIVHCLGVVPEYSTDIAAAWEVVEKLRGRKWFVEVTVRTPHYDDVEVVLCRGFDNRLPVKPSHYAVADTAPLTICRAALSAAGET